MAGKPKHPGPSISPMALALRCRKLIQSSGYKATSCIETAYLIEQSALGMGLPIKRVVCQLQALYPAAAKAISQNEPLDTVWGTPGYWAVDVGHPEQPEDYVGRMDVLNNRFVGHVVCIAENHLIDASADQVSRPAKGLVVSQPVVGRLTGETPTGPHWFETKEGSLLGYWLHPDVVPPQPVTVDHLDSLVTVLLTEFQNS